MDVKWFPHYFRCLYVCQIGCEFGAEVAALRQVEVIQVDCQFVGWTFYVGMGVVCADLIWTNQKRADLLVEFDQRSSKETVFGIVCERRKQHLDFQVALCHVFF